MLATLLAYAQYYGIQAVMWVSANAHWLIPMGSNALTLIQHYFGN
ncbi:hypothetical protein [Ignavigranum ruoffiae]|nr:hypothetical protein [Ignavigranum ruoffiae]